MVERVNRKLSARAVEKDYLLDFVNKELVPVVERIRLTLDALQSVLMQGDGNPEGVVEADKGALYQNTTGTVGSLLYAKTTDDANTGWVLVL
jgi:hypothetical protein